MRVSQGLPRSGAMAVSSSLRRSSSVRRGTQFGEAGSTSAVWTGDEDRHTRSVLRRGEDRPGRWSSTIGSVERLASFGPAGMRDRVSG